MPLQGSDPTACDPNGDRDQQERGCERTAGEQKQLQRRRAARHRNACDKSFQVDARELVAWVADVQLGVRPNREPKRREVPVSAPS
jgi:hypothetical protein